MTKPILHHGDAIEWANNYEGPLYHAALMDCPYEIAFMGRKWDAQGVSFRVETWAAFKRIMHPGAFGMTFAGSRTFHRIAVAIEDAGFILHPAIGWATGSSFPKATRIDTQIDAAAGAEREFVGYKAIAYPDSDCWGTPNKNTMDKAFSSPNPMDRANNKSKAQQERLKVYAPATDLARAWAGHRYGLQALKPALEFIVVFQKPYAGRPVESMVATGAGALNIDGARVASADVNESESYLYVGNNGGSMGPASERLRKSGGGATNAAGRWPANLVLSHSAPQPCPYCDGVGDCGYCLSTGTLPGCERIGTRRVRGVQRAAGSPGFGAGRDDGYVLGTGAEFGPDETVDEWRCAPGCAVAALGAQSGETTSSGTQVAGNAHPAGIYSPREKQPLGQIGKGDTGTAARYFFQADYAAERIEAADPIRYVPKASTAEREAGLSGRQKIATETIQGRQPGSAGSLTPYAGVGGGSVERDGNTPRANIHPTLKPIALARHLATLLLPPALYAPRRLFIPFAGVASECIGAMQAGWEVVDGVELEEEHVDIGRSRIAWWAEQGVQLSLFDE